VFKISLDEVESSLNPNSKSNKEGNEKNNEENNKEGEVYFDETTGDWKAGNATLVEISGEDGTDGRLVNVNGGERVLLSVGVGSGSSTVVTLGMKSRPVDVLTGFLVHDITPLLCRYQLSRQVPNFQLLPRGSYLVFFLQADELTIVRF
jgi:hypothetical protein